MWIARSVVVLGIGLLAVSARAQQKWTVHEWGTFTSLQDENGDTVGGINTDDEPVPAFVHRLAEFLLLRPTEVPNNFFQGAPSCHPGVTMRLETPVIYFHPPSGQTNASEADVKVDFRGGWLSEYYPNAHPDAREFTEDTSVTPPRRLFRFGALDADSSSSLTWKKLKIGGDWALTNTSAHVWTSPRAVSAAEVRAAGGEAEKFLFYRGVAHINAPLKISRDAGMDQLLIRSQLGDLATDQALVISHLWLVDIRPQGNVAFRTLPPVTINPGNNKFLERTDASFKHSDFNAGNLEKLKGSLQVALVADGFFADEARALLNTWELSYFKSPGLRVFFLVPRAWTDHYLPLEISLPADINRVMVGRIELVTPEQRKILQTIAQSSAVEIQHDLGTMLTNFYAGPAANQWNQLVFGGKSLASTIPVPRSYQTYLDLGRFRNALILEDVRRHPALTNFIAAYRLEAHQAD
jgi:hypothetical protein